jgi:HNH endonuclease
VTRTTTQRGYGRTWQKLRPGILARDRYTCHWCGRPANAVDHVIGKADGGTDHPDNLVASCTPCNSARSLADQARRRGHRNNKSTAYKYAAAKRKRNNSVAPNRIKPDVTEHPIAEQPFPVFDGANSGGDVASADFLPGRPSNAGSARSGSANARSVPDGPGITDRCWAAAPWLDELRAEAVAHATTWPRVMTAPHPSAVGSYGADAVALIERIEGRPVRWWQRLALTRQLEHDADGRLCWLWVLLSTPRQVGKTWLLRGACMWRVHQGDRFGESQDVLHTAKDLPVTREAQRPAKAWARRHRDDGWKVRETNGQDEVTHPDGSRWMLRARDAVYSYGASLGVVDEAWKVSPAVVDDGLEPTMAEREQAQGLLVSTAHRRATPLFPARREAAAVELRAPTDTLLVEWSAPFDADIYDRSAWRAASPHWSQRRERLLEAKLARAEAGDAAVDEFGEGDPIVSFRSQWLNIWAPWPPDPNDDGRDEALIDDADWSALGDLTAVAPPGVLHLAAVDWFGQGCATAAAGRGPDGRVFLWGRTHPRRVDAVAWLTILAADHPGSVLHVAPALTVDTATVPVTTTERAGATETRSGLAVLRDAVRDGAVIHDGGSDLAGQLHAARVVNSPSGLRYATRAGRTDLVTAAVWALTAARVAPVEWFVY